MKKNSDIYFYNCFINIDLSTFVTYPLVNKCLATLGNQNLETHLGKYLKCKEIDIKSTGMRKCQKVMMKN